MESSRYQEFKLLPDSFLYEKKIKKQMLGKNDSMVNIEQDLDSKNKSYDDENDINTFDDLPFVVPSKRIVIEWPIDLLKSLKFLDFENKHSTKYELDDIEICKIVSTNERENFSQEQKHQHERALVLSQEHEPNQNKNTRINIETQLGRTKAPTNLRLKYMQVYIMGGYAKKYFYNKEQNSYSIRVEIKKNQENQAIKVINILERNDMHYFPCSNNILSPFRSNYEYRKFILSQINANKSMFRLNSQQYKLQIFKFLNLKIPIKCDDQIHFYLGNCHSKHEFYDDHDHQISRRNATLPITKQNLFKLTKDGGFQILVELKDHLSNFQTNINQQNSTHSFSSQNLNSHPDTFIGYILLSIQKA
ncbi:uncharacterized protein ELE39_000943 [Cryptosporidium sp. chipmunk genotype I]|uniref:uncharacterized protein n=1 Tax=Cryptosporidium sp. chipmunk genotype I TaxID=1280935 RepID=UPI003519ED33|nr:hypothetical protein ELE39_000943 [Cryptosporidium sp. chipmunk genotype I]